MPTTPNYSLRYPASGVTPDVPRDIGYLATDVDGVLNSYDLSGMATDLADHESRITQNESDIADLQAGATLARIGLYQASSSGISNGSWNTINCSTVDAGRSSGQSAFYSYQGSGVHRLTQAGVYAVSFRVETGDDQCWVQVYNDTLSAEHSGMEVHTTGPVNALTSGTVQYIAANTDLRMRVYGFESGSVQSGQNTTWLRIIKLGA